MALNAQPATNGHADSLASSSSLSADINPPVTNGVNGQSLTTRVQVVNEDKEFSKDLGDHIERWGLHNAGFGYDVVAVFGSQSTGKSTLLNRLFGTTFDVMDESNRQQTTKGIWMCRAQNMNVMVMDVEGTDGRERGEDQDFERKSALFSLASSEVLLVNLWEHQVGLYQGANMGLLKTVFEVNLGLFGKRRLDEATRQRTLLLFVIRDHVGSTPLANLQKTLTLDLTKIWNGLSKPEGLEDCQLTDYFDLAFTTLSHKVLVPEKFETDVQSLRKRFTDRDDPNFVFKPAYHKRIPADGVAHYMESIWEQVQSNKDLDLPTQQELLAQFRCDELATLALEMFNTQAKSVRKPVEAGQVVEGLGGMMQSWKNESMARFDRDASRYHPGVYARKRADLVAQINSGLGPLFLGQLKNLHKFALSSFKKEVLAGIKGDGYDFGEVVLGATARNEGLFREGATEVLLPDTDWSYEEELQQLSHDISLIADQCRADETKKMVSNIERTIKKQMSESIEHSLNQATPDMWDNVLRTFKETLAKAEATYLGKATSFNCTEEENTTSLAILRKRAWQALRAKVDEQLTDLTFLAKLKSRFEEKFRYDKEGVPRVWKPDDDVDSVFRAARDELIPLFSKIQPKDRSLEFSLPSDSDDSTLTDEGEFDFEATLVVFTEAKQADLSTRFRRDADAYYVEAKRSMVSSIAQIPTWIYGVMVVLGWNEAMAVIRNPIYFLLLLMGLAGFYIVVQLNLSGPLYNVAKSVGNEVHRQASQRIREQFAEPPQPQLTRPMTNGTSDEYEPRRRQTDDSRSSLYPEKEL
ncbi:hypothetical protein BOTBODRAFT_208395 [Botryobasidium botryosum FD-172 SS1]|uniref:GB1/RHD3-type G domain-containing protein n=1 Tax=Botryobasidium botryosum (strain FD-172 SS1) TaxID=930990 RepID=A0A067N0S1_BOTB1|nr:hypothetical protein BOTBODRAFT_208395 [Botryobasidium botryosum FD-172 SS1]